MFESMRSSAFGILNVEATDSDGGTVKNREHISGIRELLKGMGNYTAHKTHSGDQWILGFEL
jgi:hypothetical protein